MQIPEELVLNIVAALPLASAFRCKLLSKRLNCLISSPPFWSLRQRLAPDNTHLLPSDIVNQTLTAVCPKTGQIVSFRAPTSIARTDIPFYVEASESGLLLLCTTLSTRLVWNPLTGWWRRLPALERGAIGYGSVVGMIVENDGCESISFKVFAVGDGSIYCINDDMKATALLVFNSVEWKWSYFTVGHIDAHSWVFRQRHNVLVAYFLDCTQGRPPRLCTFHFASNQLIESNRLIERTVCTYLQFASFVVNHSLVVNQSSSGRTRALFLLYTCVKEGHEDLVREGHEAVVQLLEGEEGDEVGSWAPWTLVSSMPLDSRVIGQSEDGKTLYIGHGWDLLLHDIDSHKEHTQLGGNFFNFAFVWTPSASMCSQTKR